MEGKHETQTSQLNKNEKSKWPKTKLIIYSHQKFVSHIFMAKCAHTCPKKTTTTTAINNNSRKMYS